MGPRGPAAALAAVILQAVVEHAPELAARAQVDGSPRPAVVPDPRFTPDGTTSADTSTDLSVEDLLVLVRTWSYVALSPAREAVLAQVRDAARAGARADGTVRLVQHVEVHRFRRA